MGLAAALATLGAFKGAAALESMMAETASERQLLPTVSHLRDLLNVLEYKLVRTGFAESAAGLNGASPRLGLPVGVKFLKQNNEVRFDF